MNSELRDKIDDMIQRFETGAPPEQVALRLLDILNVINERMDRIEQQQTKQHNETKTQIQEITGPKFNRPFH